MRNAFSMITAIFVIVIMASVAAFVLNLSGKVVKSTTTQYQHEQAELYAKSYTEYAILAVTGHDRAGGCLKDITGHIGHPSTGDGYQIHTRIAYIVNGTIIPFNNTNCSSTRLLSTGVTETSTPMSILVDVYVDYKDPDNPSGPWLTVHRRSIQKI